MAKETPMITATLEARKHLAKSVRAARLDPAQGECFRMRRENERQMAVVPGKRDENDVEITHEDDTVLVIESNLADRLGDSILDIKDGGQGRKILFWI
jgi:hypothetical protein